MKNNETHSNGNVNETEMEILRGRGEADDDNPVTFPNNDETQLQDISTLLEGAPVIAQSAASTDRPASEIASAADFEQVAERKPFSRRLWPKATAGAIVSGLLMLPLSFIFLGGGSKQAENVAVVEESAEGETYVSPEDYAAMQAELEQLRSQQAFTNQQVDADAIDAAGRQQQNTQTKPTAKPTTAAKPSPAPRATTVSSRPAPRSTPTPSRVVTPAPRATPVAASPQPARVIQAPTRAAEPVDPFERRAQLQALGTYGAPPPTAQFSQPVGSRASNPFETANPYIQAIAVESPQIQPAFSSTQTATPVEKPLTEEELQYQQDANAVLEAALSTESDVEGNVIPPKASEPSRGDSAVINLRRRLREPSERSQTTIQARSRQPTAPSPSPMAIMPGTSAAAELPYGFSWQEGTQLPEILLSTTEDIMAGDRTAIPSGTQFLGQAQVDPSSGTVSIQIVGIFGETQDIQIPRASLAVQSADGGVLTAKASGGPSRSSGPNVSGFLMESLGNSVSNILGNGDDMLTDIGGGIAETIIDDQIAQSRARAAVRNSRSASQPTIWTLDDQSVQLIFNKYVPINSASR